MRYILMGVGVVAFIATGILPAGATSGPASWTLRTSDLPKGAKQQSAGPEKLSDMAHNRNVSLRVMQQHKPRDSYQRTFSMGPDNVFVSCSVEVFATDADSNWGYTSAEGDLLHPSSSAQWPLWRARAVPALGNITLTAHGKSKLFDFGTSKLGFTYDGVLLRQGRVVVELTVLGGATDTIGTRALAWARIVDQRVTTAQ